MKARILVVEDDNIVSLEIQYTLESLGYEVSGVAASGKAAIENAASSLPDLVLMDIRLKGSMDGVEAATKIRDRLKIPIVYLSAFADDDTLARAKTAEPYGYIIKPFEEKELQTAIEMALYRHQMESKVWESEQWLSTTLISIGDAVLATDAQGKVSFMNPVASDLTGWTQDEALGQESTQVLTILEEASRFTGQNPVQLALAQKSTTEVATHILLSRNGKEIPIEHRAAPITDEENNVTGVVLVFRDIGRRKQAEEERQRLQEQLYQAQKMEAIGVLAAGIAHEFNNLMTTIIGYSSLFLSQIEDADPLYTGVQHMRRAGEQASSLTQQLLALSRRQTSQPRAMNLNRTILSTEEMIQHLAGEGTKWETSLDPNLDLTMADPAHIEQLVINLLVNAQEALVQGGAIAVATRNVSLDRDVDLLHPDAYAGAFVHLTIADTGIGMDEDTIEHIFDPFFSTKEKGTGLGLTIARNIASQHKGWIEVTSKPEQGSVLDVYLPAIADDAVFEQVSPAVKPSTQDVDELVLLVEDNKGVCAAVSEMLRAGGYQVLAVGSAREALDTFEARAGDFDLILSDVVLPDRDGIELTDMLSALRPGIPILLVSGYTDHRSQWSVIRERGLSFLQKPFSLSDLLQAVRQAMETSQADSRTEG